MNEVHQAVVFTHGLLMGAGLASFFWVVGYQATKQEGKNK